MHMLSFVLATFRKFHESEKQAYEWRALN